MSRTTRSITAAAALTLIGTAMLPRVAWAAPSTESGAGSLQRLATDPITDVGAPALSYNGRFMAYVSTRRDQTPPRPRLLRRDLVHDTDALLNPSVDDGAARGRYSMPPAISSDGSRVSYTSTAARLLAGDTNGKNDAFVRDVPTSATLLASRALGGGFSNGATGMESLSRSGRFAVFTSSGTDLVAGSTTTNSDVYRRDLSTGTTVQVTVRPNGAPSRGPGSNSTDVSASGNLVAFSSYNSDLTAADGNDGEADLFVRNMTTRQTRWLSPGLPAGANPSGVVISPGGEWLSSRWDDGSLHLTRVDTAVTSTVVSDGYAGLGAFSSQQGLFVYVSGGHPYVRDLARGTSSAIPVPDGGVVTNVSISGDGAYAAYDWTPFDGGPAVIYRATL